MTTLYEQINKYCEMGFYPIVSDGKEYIIVSPTKDSSGNWRDTSPCDSLEEATKYIGYANGYSKESWEEKESKGWKIIGFYHPPAKRLKIGDKVKIRENFIDLQYRADWKIYNDYTEEYQSTAGLIGKITGLESCTYTIYFDNLEDCFYYSHDQIEPYIEKEPEKPQTINIGGKTYEVTLELTEALKNLKEIE